MPDKPFMAPGEALRAAFDEHDFMRPRPDNEHEDIGVSTIIDHYDESGAAIVDVDVQDNPIENAVSYRYRIEYIGPAGR